MEIRKGMAGFKPILAFFEEFSDKHADDIPILYSIKEWHKVFVEEGDLTEYSAAMKLVGDWQEWRRIVDGAPSITAMVDTWKEEIKTKIKSEAQKRILSLVERKDSVGLSAAKWIAEEGWDGNKKGRPTKAAVRKEKEKIAKAAKTTEEEMGRVLEMVRN